MNESMMLLGRCLSNTQNELAFEDCFSREDYINKSSRLNKGLEGYFTYYFTAFNETGFHSKNFQVPKRRNSIKLDLSLKSVEILYYLTFPLLVKKEGSSEVLKGNTELFRDIQSLLFLTTIHQFLPLLDSEKMRSERQLLLSCLHHHCHTVWAANPPHQFYLLSTFFDFIGDKNEALRYAELSYKLSDTDDHDFLTKAQEYWTLLIENHLIKKAENFLIKLIRTCPPECIEEVKKVIKLHYEIELHRAKRA